jgi:hypothetical protein
MGVGTSERPRGAGGGGQGVIGGCSRARGRRTRCNGWRFVSWGRLVSYPPVIEER